MSTLAAFLNGSRRSKRPGQTSQASLPKEKWKEHSFSVVELILGPREFTGQKKVSFVFWCVITPSKDLTRSMKKKKWFQLWAFSVLTFSESLNFSESSNSSGVVNFRFFSFIYSFILGKIECKRAQLDFWLCVFLAYISFSKNM